MRRDLLAMVDRDFNHPSIIVWSIYNEQDWGIQGLWSGEEQQGWLAGLYRDEGVRPDPPGLRQLRLGHVLTDLNDYH